MQLALQIYAGIMEYSVPFAFGFGVCNYIYKTIVAAAFGERFTL